MIIYSHRRGVVAALFSRDPSNACRLSSPQRVKKSGATGLPRLIQLRVSDELEAAIEGWREGAADRPTRSEAVRRLIEEGLRARSADQA